MQTMKTGHIPTHASSYRRVDIYLMITVVPVYKPIKRNQIHLSIFIIKSFLNQICSNPKNRISPKYLDSCIHLGIDSRSESAAQRRLQEIIIVKIVASLPSKKTLAPTSECTRAENQSIYNNFLIIVEIFVSSTRVLPRPIPITQRR